MRLVLGCLGFATACYRGDGTLCTESGQCPDDAPVDLALTDDSPGDTFVGCPSPATYPFERNGTVYRLSVTTQKPWTVAAADCAGDASTAHLAVISSEQERSFVQALSAGTPMWIGLSDLVTEGTFSWLTAENTAGYPPSPPQSPWANGEPDVGVDERCIELDGTADFANERCDQSQSYVCECDAFANDPSRYGQ